MNDRPKVKLSKRSHFWRACRYLWPYRAKVAISVIAAVFVGLALTGGLTTMLPVMQVLINGDTMPGWMYRQTAQARLKVKFVADPGIVQIGQKVTDGPGKQAGLRLGDEIVDASSPAHAPPSPFPAEPMGISPSDTKAASYRAGEVLRKIAWADRGVQLNIRGRGNVAVALPPLKWYFALGLRVIQDVPLRPVTAVAVVFVLLACLTLVGSVMRYFQEHLSDKAAILAANDIRRRVYDRVLRIPISSLSRQGASDATSRLITDVDNLQDGFKTVLGQSIQEPIKALMMFGLALYLSWQLTCFIVLLVPLMYIMMRKFGKKMRRASRAALRSSSTLLGQIDGTLVGIRVVKGFNAEKFERRRYTKILDKLVAELVRMSRVDAISSPVMETIIMLVAGMVILLAAYLVTEKHTLTQTSFFTVMFSLAVIADSLRKASKVNNALQKANAAAARIFETLDLPPERDVTSAPRKLPPLRLRIEFQNIAFSYPNANMPALDGVSLVVPKGQSVAIVGRNGSGKTTLLALLERFYEPDGGRILIDGMDIRTASRTSLREQISLVTQDSHIFPGTIAENIAYGEPLADPEAPDSPARRALFERVEEAARRAFAHDFIMEKPGGYNMVLGGLGGQLSGGQKQRLCIARAVFHQAPILILDEATSQVDAESEHLIHQAIEQLMHERTTFVIAHRFSTILSADTIVVMERGRIVGQGKHDELLSSCKVYQQLYERQLIGAPSGE
ncbi:MAG TPA: ABC transporter ATP-binding protein [Tepidisphaeraceae bacterium]|nr:ABC transporter ATP-binding protein [Tepidisphaeraceae bacterium]